MKNLTNVTISYEENKLKALTNNGVVEHRVNSIDSENLNLIQTNHEETTNDRVFNYGLDEKAIRLKLLKGAKRPPIDIENKKTCSNLIFSDGAYNHCVKPWLNTIAKCHKSIGIFKFENEDVGVANFLPGFDKYGNHVDTKIVLVSKNYKHTLHIYNSTQKIKVDGRSFDTFANNTLKPYFTNLVNSLKADIIKYDTAVIETLGTKFVKAKKVQGNSDVNSLVSCNRCNFSTKSNLQLKKHKQKNHTKGYSITNLNPPLTPDHSTRENSRIEIMHEDLSIINVSDELNILDINIQNDHQTDPLMIEFETPQINLNLDDNIVVELEENIVNIEEEIEVNINKEQKNTQNLDKSLIDKNNEKDTNNIAKVTVSESNTEPNEFESNLSKELVKCYICNEELPDLHIKQHIEIEHVQPPKNDISTPEIVEEIVGQYECNKCEKTFSTSEDFNEHTNLHLFNEYMNPNEAKDHTESEFCKELLFICGECSKSFDSKRECITHMDKHKNCYLNTDPVLIFPCDECKVIFVDKSALHDHKTQHHINRNSENINNDLEVKIDSSLNVLHKDTSAALNVFNTKFDLSLNKLDEVVRVQNVVIKELEEKVDFLSGVINKERELNAQLRQQQRKITPPLNLPPNYNHESNKETRAQDKSKVLNNEDTLKANPSALKDSGAFSKAYNDVVKGVLIREDEKLETDEEFCIRMNEYYEKRRENYLNNDLDLRGNDNVKSVVVSDNDNTESNAEFIKRKKQYYENKKGNYQKNDRDHRDLYRENEYNYFCEQCSYNGTSTNQLKKHIESSHKVKKQIEKFTHAPEKVLQKHVKIAQENREQIYACHLCNFTENRKEHLKAHITNVHTHTCNQCDFDSSSKSHLEKHIETTHKINTNVNQRNKNIKKKYCHFWNNVGYCKNEGNCDFLHEKNDMCEMKSNCNVYLCQFYHEDFYKRSPQQRY